MHEVICINIGQAGVQLSNAVWELFCTEHGIEANGRLKESVKDDGSQSFTTLYCEAPNGQYVPRTLSVDLEPTVIDEVRSGAYRNLFHPDQLINVNEDGCNNYARAHWTVGKNLIEHVVDTTRKLVENCDSLQGFFILHSHGGGTGSGFTSLLLANLNVEFSKNSRFQLSIFPSPILSSAIVEPYNCILSANSDIEQSDITTIVNNEAIYGICGNLLGIVRPSFSNINRVISHIFSDLTVSLRFESALSADFCQMSTNLIPYPRIHFPLVCHAPFTSLNKAEHETSSTQMITHLIFDDAHQLITCDTSDGLYMSCVMLYRGNVTPKDVNESIFEIKRQQQIKFVDWCPTGFKIGISSQASAISIGSEMAQNQRSLTMVTNTTSIKDPINKILSKFLMLLEKRAFVHWFVGEGMEEGEFMEANDQMVGLIMDYDELSVVEGEDEDDETMEPSHDVDQNQELKANLSSAPSQSSSRKAASESSVSKPAMKLKESSESKISVTRKSTEEEESEVESEHTSTGDIEEPRTVDVETDDSER